MGSQSTPRWDTCQEGKRGAGKEKEPRKKDVQKRGAQSDVAIERDISVGEDRPGCAKTHNQEKKRTIVQCAENR